MSKLREIQDKAKSLRKQLAVLDKLTGGASERERDVERKRAQRAATKEVVIPPCADRARRERLEADDIAWLMYYFGPECGLKDPFWYEFTTQQREMISATQHAILFGGDQAIAASRGEGKTTIFERLLLKYTKQGVLSFSVLCAATGTLADNSLDTIKGAIEDNPLLLADYPEVCVPVRALENTPNRAGYQLVSGERHDNGQPYQMASSKFSWCGQEIVFPNVPGSPSAQAIIATRGLDSAIRGLKRKGRRPQLVGIDDPETEDTVRSSEQASKLEDRIDRALAGLGSQQKAVARVMLTTLQNRTCVSFTYTDPQQKPTWKGKRFRYLVHPPERTDLWDEYVQLRVADLQTYAAGESDDPHCRRSHQFYLDRAEEMNAGAEVANLNRFNGERLPDGSQVEVSALQHYFNEIARIGPEAVATELDNDPPEEMGPIESGISASKIQLRLSGYPARMVPPECKVLVQGIDIQKAGGHWIVRACRADATSYVIDYGFQESHGTKYGSDEGVEHAVRRVILDRMDFLRSHPYCDADGKEMPVALTLVDSGWQTQAVYQACADIGLGIYPSKGHGRSHGCATPNFYDVLRATQDRKPGDGWFMQRQASNVWLVHCDTDRWKSFEHARWLTDVGKPGAAYLFGDVTEEERKYLEKRMPREAKEHHSYAHHLTSEVEVEEVVRGSLKRHWKVKAGRVQNHYLDASYLTNVAANMLGIRLLKASEEIVQERKAVVISSGFTKQARW